jgi:hypothetical protein
MIKRLMPLAATLGIRMDAGKLIAKVTQTQLVLRR